MKPYYVKIPLNQPYKPLDYYLKIAKIVVRNANQGLAFILWEEDHNKLGVRLQWSIPERLCLEYKN